MTSFLGAGRMSLRRIISSIKASRRFDTGIYRDFVRARILGDAASGATDGRIGTIPSLDTMQFSRIAPISAQPAHM